MSADQAVLIDAPLVADPDADAELGPADAEAIADEDLKGSRLLLVRRVAEPIDLDGISGGAIEFACIFQPAQGTRFASARLLLHLQTPEGIRIVDLAPREVREREPVRFVLDHKGKLSANYMIAETGAETGTHKEFAVYHCAVQGSGESTALARWDFKENPHRRDGLGTEQTLALILPVIGSVTGTVSVTARLVRAGLQGRIEAIRDLILGAQPHERYYPIAFVIPQTSPPSNLAHFLRLMR